MVVAVVASVLLCAALAVAAGTRRSVRAADVRREPGDELERRLPVSIFGERIGQTLCFDFTGDGREDIVFTGWLFANRGAHYWAAFRARGDGWSTRDLQARLLRRCGARPGSRSGARGA